LKKKQESKKYPPKGGLGIFEFLIVLRDSDAD